MAETTTAATRDADLRRYADFNVINGLVQALMFEFELNDTDKRLRELLCDDFDSCDMDGTRESALFNRLWPTDEHLKSFDYEQLEAECGLRLASIWLWLASKEGQDFCMNEAARALELSQKAARQAKEYAKAGDS